MTVSAEDAAVLQRWWRFCLHHPGRLPEDVAPVLTRLVRAVGRGELPHRGSVFVKVMGFPRARDRWRYAWRALPAVHEARMLEAARRAGLVVPDVVEARALRVLGVPRLCWLVTAALDVAEEPPPSAALAGAAAALAAAGIDHPDLHPGNFVALAAGGTAVLDLQSARRRNGPLNSRQRLRMAAKLLSERPDAGDALVDAGLITGEALEGASRAAARLVVAGRLRRIRRCMQESTEFTVRRRWNGTLYARRTGGDARDVRVEGGRELLRYWLGDRTLEVLDGREPLLGALFLKSWWLPGPHSVYIFGPSRRSVSPAEAATLLEGFERYQAMTTEPPAAPGRREGRR